MKRIQDLLLTLQYEMVMGLDDGDLKEYFEFNFYCQPSKSVPGAVMRGRFTLWPSRIPTDLEPPDEHD